MCANSYDIICLTETWLMEGISDSELFDDRYLVWRRDRDYTSTGQVMGGGVLVAVRRELVATENRGWCSSAEDIWVTLTLHRKNPKVSYKMHLGVVYICNQKLGNTLSEQLNEFSKGLMDVVLAHPADKFLVLGDFNQSNIVWQPLEDDIALNPTNLVNSIQLNFIDNLNICNLQQYNHYTNINNKILDLVLSNGEVSVGLPSDPLVIEDPHHKAICITTDFVQYHSLPVRPYVKFLYNLADYDAIRSELDQVDWRQLPMCLKSVPNQINPSLHPARATERSSVEGRIVLSDTTTYYPP
ncbi:unnamed protein product [Arctia plantaginis]|uniref:Endonuclease/exonuclease/phosphatase domain-containing protein n=1 Tax=Arctia plantaginis TaxID=874455 RepID=A0A8S1A165_ARCPL|nr:unnamed protein product [Arctia plantaginis]